MYFLVGYQRRGPGDRRPGANMPIRLEDFLAKLPPAERDAIAARTEELLTEATLRDLRRARARSQSELAKRLGIQQAAVSKLERRSDMYVSTLRSMIEAMGGQLDIIARFPGRRLVYLTQFKGMRGAVVRKAKSQAKTKG